MTDVIGSAFIDIRARVSNFETQVAAETKAAMGAATAETQLGATRVTSAARSAETGITSAFSRAGTRSASTMRSSMTEVASAAGIPAGVLKLAIPAALAATAVAAIKMASTFQAAMERIHTQAGASQAEVDRLKNAVLGMAGPVAQAPDALASGLYHIESAGFRGAQALSMLHSAAEGATIGNADLGDVTQAMIATIASGIKGVTSANDAMAQLNKTVGVGDMTMTGLAQAMSTGILPSARSAGLSLQDVSAALATITDNATPPVEAATRLRMTFSMLSAPTATAQAALKGIGISANQLGHDMQQPNGLLKAIDDLKTHLEDSGKTAVQQNAVIAKAFGGGRTSGSILTLLEESDRLKSKYEEFGTAAQRAASLQDAWKKSTETFSVQWHMLTAAVDVFMIKLGNGLMPVATNVVHFLGVVGPKGIAAFVHAMGTFAGGMMSSALSSMSSALGHIGSTLVHLGTIVGPVVAAFAAIGGAVIVGAFDGLAHALQGVAFVMDKITGFMTANKTVVAILAGVVAGALVPAIWAAVSGFAALIASNVGVFVMGVVDAIGGMIAAVVAADGAVASLSAVLDTLSITPVGAALAVIGAAVGVVTHSWMANRKAAEDAKQGVDSFVASLHTQTSSLPSLQSGLQQIHTAYSGLITLHHQLESSGQGLAAGLIGKAGFSEAQSQMQSYAAQVKTVSANSAAMGREFHLNQGQVAALAQSAGIDLTGSLGSVQAGFAKAIAAARLTHHPMQQAKADFKAIGSAATDVATTIQHLDDAWNNLVGNFVSMKQASLDARQSMEALNKALHKSHDSLRMNSAAGQAARTALLAMPDVIKTVIDSTYQQTGSYHKAAAAGQKWLDQIKNSGAAGPIVKQITSGIQKDLDDLAAKAPNAGKAVGTGYGKGVGQSQPDVQKAANNLLAAVKAKLGPDAGVIAEGTKVALGFAAGMSNSAAFAAISAAAAKMVAQAKSDLQQHQQGHSPARVVIPLGRNFADGFTVGIEHATPGVAAAATRMVDVAMAATSSRNNSGGHGFGVLAGHPAANAKKIIDDLVKGIGDHSPRFQDAVHKLIGHLDTEIASHNQKTQAAGKKLMSALITGLGDEKTRLQTVITTVKGNLSQLEQSSKSLRSSIVQAMSGLGDITQLQSGDLTGRNMITYLHENKKAVDAFQHNLHVLQRRGVSQRIINQLAQAGVGQGSAEAEALTHDSRHQLNEINRLSGSINKTIHDIGGTEAQKTFGKQIDRVSSHLHDLNVTMHDLTQVINKQNNRMRLAPTDHAPPSSSSSSSSSTASHPGHGHHHGHHHHHHHGAGTHDRGGWLAPGVHGDVVNATGRAEAVMPQDMMAEAIVRAIRSAFAEVTGHRSPLIGTAHIHQESDVDAVLRRLEFMVAGSTV